MWRQRLIEQRGDVPGWVLITAMTAALVLGIWAFAGEAIVTMVKDAFSDVGSALGGGGGTG